MDFDALKLTKPESGYINPPPTNLWSPKGKGIRCGTCIFYTKGGDCGIVESPVHSQGCCNLWSYKDRPNVEGMLNGDQIKAILDW